MCLRNDKLIEKTEPDIDEDEDEDTSDAAFEDKQEDTASHRQFIHKEATVRM